MFLTLFFLVGNALRDSLLIPSPVPRFQLNFAVTEIILRMSDFKSAILWRNSGDSFFWLLPSLWIYVILGAILAKISKSSWLHLLFIGTIGVIIAYFVVEHTFYNDNQDRFLLVIFMWVKKVLSKFWCFKSPKTSL